MCCQGKCCAGSFCRVRQDSWCEPGSKCVGNVCKKSSSGAACSSDTECDGGDTCLGSNCCNANGRTAGCTDCDDTGDCAPGGCTSSGFYNVSGACHPDKADGSACGRNDECITDACRGSNCCNINGRTTGCTDCDGAGGCAACNSSGFYIAGGDALECSVEYPTGFLGRCDDGVIGELVRKNCPIQCGTGTPRPTTTITNGTLACFPDKSAGSKCTRDDECTTDTCRAGRCCNSSNGTSADCARCDAKGDCAACAAGFHLDGPRCINVTTTTSTSTSSSTSSTSSTSTSSITTITTTTTVTTTTTLTCNGVGDPPVCALAISAGGYLGKCNDPVIGELVRTNCPAQCGTCPKANKEVGPTPPNETGPTTSGDTTIQTAEAKTNNLTDGALAGIVVAVLFGVASLGLAIFCYTKRLKQQKAFQEQEANRRADTDARVYDKAKRMYDKVSTMTKGNAVIQTRPLPRPKAQKSLR